MAQQATVISGVVRDPRGSPVAQARVYFAGGPVALPDIAALTNDEGVFSLSAPIEGTYAIACAAEGFPASFARVTVMATRKAKIQIRLKAGSRGPSSSR